MTENFSDQILQFRKKLGLNQDQMGDKLGVSGKYIGMIERGDKEVAPGSSIAKLFKLLQSSPLYSSVYQPGQSSRVAEVEEDECFARSILGETLFAAVKERLSELPYRSAGDFLIGLARYDLLTRRGHRLTAPMSDMDAELQEALDASLLDLVMDKEAPRRTMLLDYLVQRAAGDGEVDTEEIISKMPKHL